MLRRVVRALRVLLFLVGLLVLLWLPASFVFIFTAIASLPGIDASLFTCRGQLGVRWYDSDVPVSVYGQSWDVSIDSQILPVPWRLALWPQHQTLDYTMSHYGRFTEHIVSIPLWLLATLCLAWPVTSFIIARRRRGRGFEVEAKGAPLSTPLPPGEVPSPRGGEGGRVV